ncbi:MAG TPA: aminotransferase class I/II-fold pyridoxal phosphate-dependent enzyme [Planktothrix sp.]
MPIQENRSTSVTIDGKDYVYFGGTNYLGLSRRPELMRAGAAAFEKYGFSAGASRVTSGESDLILLLESNLCAFALSEAALVVPAGYMANSMVVDGIDDMVDAWVILPNAHSSIKTPLRQNGKPIITYSDDLDGTSIRERNSIDSESRLAYILEPVDPLTGELFDLNSLVPKLRKHDFLILDEAHSFGVLGDCGRGALEHFALIDSFQKHAVGTGGGAPVAGIGTDNRAAHGAMAINVVAEARRRGALQAPSALIRTGTFSKAIGTYGGFILASADVISQVKQRSGGYKASTALSPVVAGATIEAIRLIQSDRATTVDQLKHNIKLLNGILHELGVDQYRHNAVPIYYLRNSSAITKLREDLPSRGIYIPTVTNYFAEYCEIGLRWTIQAGHTNEHFRFLQQEFSRHLQPASL